MKAKCFLPWMTNKNHGGLENDKIDDFQRYPPGIESQRVIMETKP